MLGSLRRHPAMLGVTLALIAGIVIPLGLAAVTKAPSLWPGLLLGGALGLTAFFASAVRLGRAKSPMLAFGSVVLACCLATISLNGVRLLAFADLSDVLLALCLPFLAAGALLNDSIVRLPRWVWLSTILILLSALISLPRAGVSINNVAPAFQLTIGVLGLTLAIIIGASSPERVHLAVRLWLLSAILSAGVAASDASGFTAIGPAVIHIAFAGRVTGLSVHPTHLGLTSAMAIPALIAIIVRPVFAFDRLQAVPGFVIVALGGVLFAGSRAAVVGALAGTGFVLVIAPVMRTRWRVLAGISTSALALTAATVVTRAAGIPALDRLFGFENVTASDQSHVLASALALTSILANPFMGIGYQVSRDAHDIYLQVLEAGGAVALTGLLYYAGGLLWTALRHSRASEASPPADRLMMAALGGSALAWFVGGVFQNPLYDRFLFIPGALLVGFVAASHGPRIHESRSEATGAIARGGAAPTTSVGDA